MSQTLPTRRADGRAAVLLLRDVPERRLRSMERLADETERGFISHPAFSMRAMTLHESARAAKLHLGRADSYLTRFVRYPLAARTRRADVYHIIDHGYAHVAAMLPHARTVISCHDLMLMKAAQGVAGFTPGRTALARFRWSTSWLRRVAHVVCPTESTRQDLIALRGVAPERTSVVPYGVDARFQPMPEPQRAALKSALVPERTAAVLQVSTGSAYKNVPGTLRAIAALRAAGTDARLVRAGAPLTAAELALAATFGISASIVDCGRVDEERLLELYNACDVLLFPSFYEGYGWPPLEAMACGTPVVTSDCAPLLEVTSGAALHAPAADASALAAAVRAILESDDLAASLRRRGIERAGEFTWQRTVDGFAQAYERVTETNARRSRDEERSACAA